MAEMSVSPWECLPTEPDLSLRDHQLHECPVALSVAPAAVPMGWNWDPAGLAEQEKREDKRETREGSTWRSSRMNSKWTENPCLDFLNPALAPTL